MRKELLYRELSRKILVLDGAMGTMLQAFHLGEQDFRGEIFRDHPRPLAGDNDVLSLTRPDLVRSVHRQYLEAGADAAFAVVSLHSFSYHHGVLATTIWQTGLPPFAMRNGAAKRLPSFGRRCFDPSE